MQGYISTLAFGRAVYRTHAFMHKAYMYQQSSLYIHLTQMLLAADLVPWPPTHTKRPRYLPDARSQHNSKGSTPP